MNEQEKLDYLLYQFCLSDYERKEMNTWIDERGTSYVYDIVTQMFEKK